MSTLLLSMLFTGCTGGSRQLGQAEMKVAPLYRSVLKQLHRACLTRPHFVEDIRFLLSLPSYADQEAHSQPSPPLLTSFADVTRFEAIAKADDLAAASSSTSLTHDHQDLLAKYLHRPDSECYAIDRSPLFALCFQDLRNAVHAPPPPPSAGNANPVAMQILRYRNLKWLQERLSRVLSSKTTKLLATSLSISKGTTESDFIPDEFFEKTEAPSGNSSARTPGNNTNELKETPHERANGTSGALSTGEETVSRVAPASETSLTDGASASDDHASSAMSSAGPLDECDPDVVYSAGAIGQQQEMFVLRHCETFPMAARFLSAFSTLPETELAAAAHQQAALTQLVRERIPTSVTCEDANISLSVTLEPYDAQYTTKEHAGIGYFAASHRQFRMKFALEPLTSAGEEGEKLEVLVVNSYFVRLDMELMQLVEEVGYLHSADVLRMLRQRDYSDYFSDFMGDRVTEGLDEDALSSHGKGKEGEKAAPLAQPFWSSAAPEDARTFSLWFANHSDAPMVLKGILYYKLDKRNCIATAPIRRIPFGFVLIEA